MARKNRAFEGLFQVDGRKLLFPDTKDFSKLFTLVPKESGGVYCSVRGEEYRTLYVKPVKEVDAAVTEYMQFGRYSFAVTVRDDGTSLITADYSDILGGAWIAVVETKTIP